MPMCIAILNNGKMLPKKKLQNCWNNNDDGAGILYIQDGKLQVEKFSNAVAVNSTQNFDKFFKRYTDIKSSASGFMPMLLHFRIATHGFSDDYLHPFLVSDDLGLIHNGVIPGFGSKELSDTAEFTQLLGTMPGMTNCEMLDIAFIEDAIYTFIGASNKLIFLDATGEYRIFNEKAGQWIGDNWFSNDSHTKEVRYYGSTAVYGKGTYDWDWGYPYEKDLTSSYTKKDDGEYHSNLPAPTEGKYGCPTCDKEVHVNYDSECIHCWTYLEDAVDEVIELWDGYDTTKLNDDEDVF
jgi:hypothetical protein